MVIQNVVCIFAPRIVQRTMGNEYLHQALVGMHNFSMQRVNIMPMPPVVLNTLS